MICRGIRLVSPDDQVALERGWLIYDSLSAQLHVEAAEGGFEAAGQDGGQSFDVFL